MRINSEQCYVAGLFEDNKTKADGSGTQGRGAYV